MPKRLVEETLLLVSINNRDRQVFEGVAKAISFSNKKGPFDVIPGHANLISLIQNDLTIYKDKGELKKISFQTGVLEVLQNRVFIYIVS